MRTLAVLPVKRFDAAKQRLAGRLDPPARAALAEAMLADVLDALRDAQAIDSVAAVTAEPRAAGLARAAGAEVLPDEHEAGQSRAAASGVRHAVAHGFARVLLVPGDTPLLSRAELDGLVGRAGVAGHAAAIVPDRHLTGTNALLLSPPDVLTPSFGGDSLARHLAALRASGLAYGVERVEGLELDVDTPDDLEAMARALRTSAPRQAARTRAVLTGLAATRRPVGEAGAATGVASRTDRASAEAAP